MLMPDGIQPDREEDSTFVKRIERVSMKLFPISRLSAGYVCMAILIGWAAPTGFAQQTIGIVSGRVVDPSGAAVAGARITVADPGGRTVQSSASGPTGEFYIPGLAPGKYSFKVEAGPFQTATATVEISQGVPTAPLQISLKLRDVSQRVNVSGQIDSLTTPPAALAEAQLETLPGNVSQIPADQYRSAAVLSMDDALSQTPGVFAEPKQGTEEVRLSIRGSGMNVPFGIRGVTLLRDGIPQSLADGYSNSEQIDPLNADYIEVYRGSDGLEYGAASLGGAINFVSPTGRSQTGLEIRSEFGSNSYFRDQIRYGGVTADGRLDGFISVSGIYTNGFRQNGKESIFRVSANTGYSFTGRSEGRLYLDFANTDTGRPGALTLARLQSNPFQAAAGVVRADARIGFKPLGQIAYKHTVLLGIADNLSFYGQYLNTQLQDQTSFGNYSGPEHKVGLGLRHEINRTWGGHNNRFVWGADYAHYWDTQNLNGPIYFGDFEAEPNRGVLQIAKHTNSRSELYVQDSLSLTESLAAVVGGQFSYSQLGVVATTPTPPTYFPIFLALNAARNYTGFNPKAGVTWGRHPKAQFFANVSRSFEPPDQYEFSPAYSASVTSLANLDAQRGITVEGGTRGRYGNFSWDLAAYHSWVHREIFSVETPPNSGQFVTFNRNHTQRFGIEAGTHGKLPRDVAAGSLNWNVAYTFSDFRFSNDPAYGSNRLPVIPPHFARFDLIWRHRSGFYFGPKVDAASSLFVDLANTWKAPGYAIVGATTGYYWHDQRFHIFLDLRNLGNRYYAATTEYVTNAHHADTAAFNPGLTRSVFGAVEIKLW
jgi:iron complex outermembrane recepter protein